jgi:phosphate transport system permease protein
VARSRSRVARSRWSATKASSYVFTATAALAFVLMVALFAWQSVPALRHAGTGYVTGTEWFFRLEQFGALSMIYGTVVVSALAIAIAAPLGIGAAICTSELLPPRARIVVKLVIELLAGVPSVVYGLVGVLYLRGFVYDGLRGLGFEPLSGDSLLTAGILLSVMVLPTVMTLADDALRAVPAAQRAAARGLGMTRAESILFVALPQATSGLVAAVMLALGRALGETIAVFLVVGRQDNQWPVSLVSLERLIEPGQTLSSKLGGAETNIAYGDPLHWGAVVGLGLVLLLLVSLVTVVGVLLERRRRRHA